MSFQGGIPMKKWIVALSLIASPLAAQAYTDGEYACSTTNVDYNYTVKTLDLSGTSVPHLEITKVVKNAAGEQTVYTNKGFAHHSTNGQSRKEYMALGSILVEFKDGKPACAN